VADVRARAPRGLALVAALALLGAIGAGCGESGHTTAAQSGEARAADPVQLVADGALLLDVRTPGEFADGHVQGALNVPVQVLESRIAELDPSRPVVVYCRSGNRSATAARMLRDRGFTVTDVGAMSDWPIPEQIVD
jgi:phage shock protein E